MLASFGCETLAWHGRQPRVGRWHKEPIKDVQVLYYILITCKVVHSAEQLYFDNTYQGIHRLTSQLNDEGFLCCRGQFHSFSVCREQLDNSLPIELEARLDTPQCFKIGVANIEKSIGSR